MGKITFLSMFAVCLFNSNVRITFAGIASTWSVCECRWESWQSWSKCTKTCGGGYQRRERRVWSLDKPGCDKFSNCATNNLGQEARQCNTQCNNGGTFDKQYSYCKCQKGTKGSCCEQIVSCGTPSSISHGSITGNDFNYNKMIAYHCDTDYNMTAPSASVRTCNENGYWTGSLPRCECKLWCLNCHPKTRELIIDKWNVTKPLTDAVSCKSSPCLNGVVCTNLLGDYFCTCNKGWTGKNCEIDIQSPELDACPDDRTIIVSQMTSTQTWMEPTFYDPHGFEVKVTKNYPISTYEFPWGVYTVQYTA
ncbi:SNED1-like protein [Mya arenaria]|uniref:SNED1-like protein n=1 Tax=Mya arenaria TaxID=6604 RepID=A0ABY7ECR8_MYAAR|nr:SNED1-like protein [Mya arenaria]